MSRVDKIRYDEKVPKKKYKRHVAFSRKFQIWQFLYSLLQDELTCPKYIYWVNVNEAIFKIKDTKTVSTMWGILKNRPTMSYESFGRCLRYYYQKKILKKVTESNLVYQFLQTPPEIFYIPQHPEEAHRVVSTTGHLPTVQKVSECKPQLVAALKQFLNRELKPLQPKVIHMTSDGLVTHVGIGSGYNSTVKNVESPPDDTVEVADTQKAKKTVQVSNTWLPPSQEDSRPIINIIIEKSELGDVIDTADEVS